MAPIKRLINKLLTVVLIGHVFCLSSCKTLTRESQINLYPEKAGDFECCNIVSDIEYVRLETTSDCNIIHISNLIITRDYILIDNLGRQLLCFDREGYFLNNVGQKGVGPGEYDRIKDFAYDPASKKVFVLSSRNTIHVYTPDGKFLKKIETQDGYATSIEVLNARIILHYANSSGKAPIRFAIYDTSGILLKNYHNQYLFDIESAVISYMHECIIYRLANELIIKELHSDTLFKLKGLDLVPYKIYNTENNSFTAEVRGSKDYTENESDYIFIDQIFETKKYLYTCYRFDEKNLISIFNKSVNKNEVLQYDIKEPNSVDGGLAIYLKNFSIIGDDRYIINTLLPHKLKQHFSEESTISYKPGFPEKKEELIRLTTDLNDNDNPVLMLIKLKH